MIDVKLVYRGENFKYFSLPPHISVASCAAAQLLICSFAPLCYSPLASHRQHQESLRSVHRLSPVLHQSPVSHQPRLRSHHLSPHHPHPSRFKFQLSRNSYTPAPRRVCSHQLALTIAFVIANLAHLSSRLVKKLSAIF